MINDMKPGPELDAIILEKLFGWRWIEGPKYDYDGLCEKHKVLIPPSISDDMAYRLFPPKGGIIAPTHFGTGRKLSTSWEGMRLVVEEMQRRGWEYAIESEGDKVHVRFFKPLEGDYAEHNGETSAPTACVKAAIKALQG